MSEKPSACRETDTRRSEPGPNLQAKYNGQFKGRSQQRKVIFNISDWLPHQNSGGSCLLLTSFFHRVYALTDWALIPAQPRQKHFVNRGKRLKSICLKTSKPPTGGNNAHSRGADGLDSHWSSGGPTYSHLKSPKLKDQGLRLWSSPPRGKINPSLIRRIDCKEKKSPQKHAHLWTPLQASRLWGKNTTHVRTQNDKGDAAATRYRLLPWYTSSIAA